MFSATSTVKALEQLFEQNKNEENAPQMERYMRHQFQFFGLKKPARQALCKQFWKGRPKPSNEQLQALVQALWQSPYREMQYHALDLMHQRIKKLDLEWIDFWVDLVVQKSWWDTVDYLAPRLIGPTLKKHPKLQKSYAQKWIAADNFWLQRTAILFQLKYKKATDVQLLFDCILQRAASTEFFVQKAAGWALREYSKTDAVVVETFIQKKQDLLAKLTIREGLKWLRKKKNRK